MAEDCLNEAFATQPGEGYLRLQLRSQANTCSWQGVRGENAYTGGLVESNHGDGVPGHTGFSYAYGYVEWRVFVPGVAPEGRNCPKGGCLPDFPALWSLPESHRTEIDTMEGLGELGEACWHLPEVGKFGKAAPGQCVNGKSYAGWHTFGALWEPSGKVAYYYDGTKVGELTSPSVYEPQYLVMDMVAPLKREASPHTFIQPLVAPDEMVVDYVRVWQRVPVTTTPAVFRNSENGDQWVYDLGQAQGHPWYWYLHGPSWGEYSLGGAAPASNSSPAGLRDSTSGDQWLYYVSADGYLDYWYLHGPNWGNYPLTGVGPLAAANSSPTALRDPATGDQWVYYVGNEGQLHYWYLHGSTWGNYPLTEGAQVAAGTSPTALRDPTTGDQWVYYTGTDGQLYYWYLHGSNWHDYPLAGEVPAASATSPTAVRSAESGDQWVYYVGTNGQLRYWYLHGATWANYSLGAGALAGAHTSPTAIRSEATADQWVYYTGTDGELDYWYLHGPTWGNYPLRGAPTAAGGTSPAAMRDPVTADQWVYYVGNDGQLHYWYLHGATWGNYVP